MGNVKEEYDAKSKRERQYRKTRDGSMEKNAGTRKTITYETGRDDLSFKPAYVNVDRGSAEHKKMMAAQRKSKRTEKYIGDHSSKESWDSGAPMRARKEIEADRKKKHDSKFFEMITKDNLKK